MTAATMDGFVAQNRKFLILSVIGHALLLVAVSSNLLEIPRQPMTRLAIDAVVVDQSTLKQTTEAERRKSEEAERQREAAAQRERDESARQQRQVQEQKELQAQETKAAEQRKQQENKAETERRKVDQQRKETEAKAAAEQQRIKAESERKLKAQREAEAKAKAEQERVAAAAKAKADAEQRAQARRQAELMATMEVEEGLMAAQASGEMARYQALIQQKVERNWTPPATVPKGLVCVVLVSQLPNGEVTNTRIESCNGDAAVQRSVEAAVMRASPLPLPDNRALFDRNLRFEFIPEE